MSTLTHASPTDSHTRLGAQPSGGTAALLAGLAGLTAFVLSVSGEITQGTTDFMHSDLAVVAGWSAFLSVCLLVVALAGLAGYAAPAMSVVGRTALQVLTFAAAVTAGAAATLALVVPTLVDELPSLVNDPPPVVPMTFILGGLVMGVSGIVVAVGLRRAWPELGRGRFVFLIIASVVAMSPLPARSFLLAFALAAVLRPIGTGRTADR